MRGNQRNAPWQVREEEFPETGTAEERARFLLRYAVLAPSTHNSQPWKFAVDDTTIRVFADESQWLDVADADKRELYFSVGCAVENLVVAATRFGFEPVVEYSSPESSVTTTVTLRDGEHATASTTLFSALTERRTNHHVYEERSLPDEVLARFEQDVAGRRAELLLADDEAHVPIAHLQTRADEAQFDDPAYRRELGHYIGSGALGATWLTARLGQLAVSYLDLGTREAKKNSRLLESAPEIGVILAEPSERTAHIEAGRGFERLFLRATSNDIAVHPMNQILQVPELKAELADLLVVPGKSLQLLFRLGYAPPEETRRPRRPVEAVLRDDEPA